MRISVAVCKPEMGRLNYCCYITYHVGGWKATVTSQLLEDPKVTWHVDKL